MKETNLKPCPFCGEELITIANGQYYSHKREQDKEKQCFGGVWTFEVDDEEMIKLWNTRKPMDSYVEQLKWERDVAISQLEKLGVGFGEKIEDEMIKAVKEVKGNE